MIVREADGRGPGVHGRTGRGETLRVVVFTGGRGSRVISEQLVEHPRVRLTLAVNGYDDGKSTGRVRRLLPDMLGPSDFRKNANRLARILGSSPPALVDLLEYRFPEGTSFREGASTLEAVVAGAAGGRGDGPISLPALSDLPDGPRAAVRERLAPIRDLLAEDTDEGFDFGDCSVGNLVFAGAFLRCGRDFNAAVDDYAVDLLGLGEGTILNVTTGEDAHLVAITRENGLLATEEALVDAARPSDVREFYLIDRPLTAEEESELSDAPVERMVEFLESRAVEPRPNPALVERLGEADLVIYAPGTQYSSLYPSYVTPGIGQAISRNLGAIKLLITNLQRDAEIPEDSAVDIIEGATYYLRGRNAARIPVPCLITHYLLNAPEDRESEDPYVPLGPVETLDDPRLVRIADYEDAATGRHDATKVLDPYIGMLLEEDATPSVGVLLLETTSVDKISQTMLEAYRGGLARIPVEPTFFYWSEDPLHRDVAEELPFKAHNAFTPGETPHEAFEDLCASQRFDFVILFESSGMYRGEDIVNLAHHVTWGQLDAVWGSRRLSVKDIHQSYRSRYGDQRLTGFVSYVGSHLLSLAYLACYGRYVSDTLSGVRAVRGSYLRREAFDLGDKCLNQHLLSAVLGEKGTLFETPVRFVPIAPEKVRRTTVAEGLRSLTTILWWRLRGALSGADGEATGDERDEVRTDRGGAEVGDTAPGVT